MSARAAAFKRASALAEEARRQAELVTTKLRELDASDDAEMTRKMLELASACGAAKAACGEAQDAFTEAAGDYAGKPRRRRRAPADRRVTQRGPRLGGPWFDW